jgi:hypothetical protein
MTSQVTPRGHHPGAQRDDVPSTRPRLSALSFFQCQAKTMKGAKVLTSMIVIIKRDSVLTGHEAQRP